MAVKLNFYRRKLPDICINFSSEKGKKLFKESLDAGYMNAYFNLGPQLRTQDEPAYCGLSSLVMVLNAFEVDPGRIWKGVWRWYHENMLECCMTLSNVKQFGVSMFQLSCIARCNQLNSLVVYADDDADIDRLRTEIKRTCSTGESGIIAAFGREVLNQTGTGHFAPIGAYHPEEDLVLLLEPARFKYPPFWIPLPLLWRAMQTTDKETGKRRGYLLLDRSDSHPTLLFHLSRLLNAAAPANQEFLKYIKKALDFLKQKVNPKDSEEDVIMKVALELLKLSLMYKESKKSLFFSVLSKEDMESFSPDHQKAINLLVRAIESTNVHAAMKVNNEKMFCCDNNLLDHANAMGCQLGTCILCFHHYLTILLFIFPLFSPGVEDLRNYPDFLVSKEEFANSYMEKVTEVTQKIQKSWREQYKVLEKKEKINVFDGKQLLINEIDELRIQVVNVIKATDSCCGF